MTAAREQFGSRLGFILAAAGSAVGIGNLVGFPVGAAKNGGGAFLFIYAIFVVMVCLPVMMAELAIGRRSQKDPLGAYSALSGGSKGWSIAGWLAVITPYMIAVFYTVLTVWLFGYLITAATGGLRELAGQQYFGQFINGDSVFVHLIIVATMVFVILMSGVKDGIERVAKILMPGLFVMLIGLVIFVLTLDGASAGVEFYLVPDFSKINASVINGALSQAFFSLSLGMGILITYGSYMERKESIPSSSKFVALTDTLVAFSAGLMILPAIFALKPDINPEELSDSSVSLIFSFLPKIFLALEVTIGYIGASIVASLFFLLVFFAALTSLVSITEVPTASLVEEKGYSRKKALAILWLSMAFLTVACTVGFGRVGVFTHLVSYPGGQVSEYQLGKNANGAFSIGSETGAVVVADSSQLVAGVAIIEVVVKRLDGSDAKQTFGISVNDENSVAKAQKFEGAGDGSITDIDPVANLLSVNAAAGAATGLVANGVTYKSLFDVIYDIFYDTILPLNGFLVCLFVVFRWNRRNFNAELEQGDASYKGSWVERYVNFSLSTFIPVILLLIFLNTVATKYFGYSFIG